MFGFIKRLFSRKKEKPSLPKQKQYDEARKNYIVGKDESIYDALEKRGWLVKPRFPKSLGLHLIKEGELGLCLDNGKPRFLAPGRYTFWSIFNKFHKSASINAKIIKLGPVQIVTVNQGELGLSKNNDEYIILEPGRYILHNSHQFIKAEALNQRYIELGTHKRITVPEGFVAIAIDKGEKIIIEPSRGEGPYITNSPSFYFDPATGFESTQLEEIKLEKLSVNTREAIELNVVGLVRYRVKDPRTAFLRVKNVRDAIKDQAEATLTSVFGQLSLDQLGASLSSTNVSDKKKSEKELHEISSDLIHKATDLFISEFKQVVEAWGIELINLNIFSMTYSDKTVLEALRTRARERMEADTRLFTLKTNTEAELGKTERENKQKIMVVKTEADNIRMLADARLYESQKRAEAGEILAKNPLAANLAILEAQANIAKNMGNNTVYMPHGMNLGAVGLRDVQGRMFFATASSDQNRAPELIQQAQPVPISVPQLH